MIPHTLQIVLCIAVICYFIIILLYLKNKRLELKYTLIWIFAGLVMGIMVFFPELLTKFIYLVGIESNMNGLYIICIAFIFILLMMLTSIASRSSTHIRELTQDIALLEKRVRELEKMMGSETEEQPGDGEIER